MKLLQGRGTTHGKSRTSTYRIWSLMISRCENENIGNYAGYGAKGIRVCQRWRESFENFYADMGERPTPKHSIDRYPDINGNYEPGNCRWATSKEQAFNKSTTCMVEYKGQRMALGIVAELVGVPFALLKYRLLRGWTLDEAIKYPAFTQIRVIRSEQYSQYAKELGKKLRTIRIGRNLKAEDVATATNLPKRYIREVELNRYKVPDRPKIEILEKYINDIENQAPHEPNSNL